MLKDDLLVFVSSTKWTEFWWQRLCCYFHGWVEFLFVIFLGGMMVVSSRKVCFLMVYCSGYAYDVAFLGEGVRLQKWRINYFPIQILLSRSFWTLITGLAGCMTPYRYLKSSCLLNSNTTACTLQYRHVSTQMRQKIFKSKLI